MQRFSRYGLFGVLLLAVFLRLFLLDVFPPGLYPDEAMNGLDAFHALTRADFRVFYEANNGREGLFINLQAIALQLFGNSAWTLRLVSALTGILTVLFLYLLARELGPWLSAKKKAGFNVKAFALLSAFFLAVSFWHVNFSRIGFRAILLPLLTTAAFYALFRARRTVSSGDFFLSGFLFGLTPLTYIAARIVPLLAFILILPDFVRDIRSPVMRRRWGVFVFAFLLAILPLAGYFVAHPQDFVGRTSDVSVLAAESPLFALIESTGKTLMMFHLVGDHNWRHNVSGDPQLDPITGALFLVGLALAIGTLKRSRFSRFALLWFLLLLVPEIVTSEGIPHALRALGVLPPVMLLSAWGGLWLWEKVRVRMMQTLRFGVVATVIVLVVLLNFHQYFFAWAGNTNVAGAFRSDLVAVADYLGDNTERTRYVIVNEMGESLDGIPIPSATIRFLTEDDPTIMYLTEARVNEITPDFDNTVIVTTSPPSDGLESTLRAAFPSIERAEEEDVTVYRL